jgi:hypothetical protein
MEDFRTIDDDQMAMSGWAAWSRDISGLICTSHAPFQNVAEWHKYVIEETDRGLRVFYPKGPMLIEKGGV